MIYRVFKRSVPQVQIAEINDPNWPLIRKGETIPLTINDRDGLYTVTKIGGPNLDANYKLIMDLWVNDFFPKAR